MFVFLCFDFRTIRTGVMFIENTDQLLVGTTFQAAGCSTPIFYAQKSIKTNQLILKI